MVVGVGIPGPVDLEQTEDNRHWHYTQVECDAAVFVPELLCIALKDEQLPVIPEIVGFNPPPTISGNREARTGLLIMDANNALLGKSSWWLSCPIGMRGVNRRYAASITWQARNLVLRRSVEIGAAWRSCNWLAGSPGAVDHASAPHGQRFAIASVQRCTFLYSCTDRNSPAP